MSLPVIAASNSAAVTSSLVASDACSIIDQVIHQASELVRSAQCALAPAVDDEIAHMRRRLFRTLDHPELPMIAIDCGTVDADQLHSASDQFLNDPSFRENHNLVLALPTDSSFASTATSHWVESLKQRAFENGLDGQISWLLIQQSDVELTALQCLVDQQGGRWYAA